MDGEQELDERAIAVPNVLHYLFAKKLESVGMVDSHLELCCFL